MFGMLGMNPLYMMNKFMESANMKNPMGSCNMGAGKCETGMPNMGMPNMDMPNMGGDMTHNMILWKLHKIMEMMMGGCGCHCGCHQNMMPNMMGGMMNMMGGYGQNCSMPMGGGGSMYHNDEISKMMNVMQMSMMFLDNLKNSTTHMNDMLKNESCSSSKECNLEALKMKIDYWQGVFDKFYTYILDIHKKSFNVMDNINENLKSLKTNLDTHLKSSKTASNGKTENKETKK